jgi:hypothetical protein
VGVIGGSLGLVLLVLVLLGPVEAQLPQTVADRTVGLLHLAAGKGGAKKPDRRAPRRSWEERLIEEMRPFREKMARGEALSPVEQQYYNNLMIEWAARSYLDNLGRLRGGGRGGRR